MGVRLSGLLYRLWPSTAGPRQGHLGQQILLHNPSHDGSGVRAGRELDPAPANWLGNNLYV